MALEIDLGLLPHGTITTPRFGGDFVEEYYKEDKDFLVILRLPGDIRDQVGSGSLVVKLDVDTREEMGWIEKVITYTLHTTEETWTESEAECRLQNRIQNLVISTREAISRILIKVLIS